MARCRGPRRLPGITGAVDVACEIPANHYPLTSPAFPRRNAPALAWSFSARHQRWPGYCALRISALAQRFTLPRGRASSKSTPNASYCPARTRVRRTPLPALSGPVPASAGSGLPSTGSEFPGYARQHGLFLVCGRTPHLREVSALSRYGRQPDARQGSLCLRRRCRAYCRTFSAANVATTFRPAFRLSSLPLTRFPGFFACSIPLTLACLWLSTIHEGGPRLRMAGQRSARSSGTAASRGMSSTTTWT